MKLFETKKQTNDILNDYNSKKIAGAFDNKFIKSKNEDIEKLSLKHHSYTLKILGHISITWYIILVYLANEKCT